MNRRRFLQAIGVIAAGPAVVAKLAHRGLPAQTAPPAPPVEHTRFAPLDFSLLSEQIVQRAKDDVRLFQYMQWNEDMLDDDVEPHLRTRRWNALRAQGFAIERAITG